MILTPPEFDWLREVIRNADAGIPADEQERVRAFVRTKSVLIAGEPWETVLGYVRVLVGTELMVRKLDKIQA